MLEFKNVSIARSGKPVVDDLSFTVESGTMMCVAGAKGRGKTTVVEAALGMIPVQNGYITIDGEQMTALSGPTFRREMGYVEQRLLLPYVSVNDMIDDLNALKVNRKEPIVVDQLAPLLEQVGLRSDVVSCRMADLTDADRRLVLLTLIRKMRRTVVLDDDPRSMTEVELLREMAREGAAVVVTEGVIDASQIGGNIINI